MKTRAFKRIFALAVTFLFLTSINIWAFGGDKESRRKAEIDQTQKEFDWWPTDAKPAPVKDEVRGGYWWWPTQPGQKGGDLWGNRGYVYVYKVIFDYRSDELEPPKPQEMRASLVIKKIIKNVKVYFDYNKSSLRDDAVPILKKAVYTLKNSPEADILITGNADVRGSESYNEKLGRRRGEAVKQFMLDEGISQERIRIVSRGKLDAVAFVTDLVGMQKDRNAQFMLAEVEEVMIPYAGGSPQEIKENQGLVIEEGKAIQEEKQNVETEVKVSTREYTIKKNDSLWKIAQNELGSGHRWKYLYELNKNKIKNPNKLRVGTKITIPVE
ncbi:MAG: OmpA family protein [Candidatus Omnitrophica bacterium]|nr:OmpA family protein [Candidatus Omnitrophota bacterium]